MRNFRWAPGGTHPRKPSSPFARVNAGQGSVVCSVACQPGGTPQTRSGDSGGKSIMSQMSAPPAPASTVCSKRTAASSDASGAISASRLSLSPAPTGSIFTPSST